ncbi:MAG: cupredoxin domain-containing protein [Candidatus Saccharibacteria bacterium]
MKNLRPKAVIASATILVIVIALSFVVFYPSAAAPSPQKTVTAPLVSGKAVATNQVAIQNYAFSPQIITIKKGTTVIWTNDDVVNHSIIFDDKHEAGSSMLNTGASYSLVFDEVGSFTYHSGVYPSTVGKVVVTD